MLRDERSSALQAMILTFIVFFTFILKGKDPTIIRSLIIQTKICSRCVVEAFQQLFPNISEDFLKPQSSIGLTTPTALYVPSKSLDWFSIMTSTASE